ncbi:hypothetical protein A6R68_11631, partial [Neotoma lepida]
VLCNFPAGPLYTANRLPYSYKERHHQNVHALSKKWRGHTKLIKLNTTACIDPSTEACVSVMKIVNYPAVFMYSSSLHHETDYNLKR